ncbi:hypothetical protein M408DRAFT_329368 [Serendipita vermifera MAFF 305830]|uniref:Uncharacterized protein n=1 Tax=Serendipita vermifera MAFF 305830 TaxID=933852 RepID=A0A0C3BB04_SERVB|nr:hypothetical protein M408DRAFT_329368 [Serendipita vermifera MAFF 305830]
MIGSILDGDELLRISGDFVFEDKDGEGRGRDGGLRIRLDGFKDNDPRLSFVAVSNTYLQ